MELEPLFRLVPKQGQSESLSLLNVGRIAFPQCSIFVLEMQALLDARVLHRQHFPMTTTPRTELHETGFELPAATATPEEKALAIAKMAVIDFSVEELDRGYAAYVRGEWQALLHFCAAQGLFPADVAAEALLLRWLPVMEAGFEGGVEIWEGSPSYAEQIGLRPLTIAEFDY